MRKPWVDVQEEDYRDFESFNAGDNSLYTFLTEFEQRVDPKNCVLEVGCGNGYFLEYLKARGFKSAVGIDIVQDAINDSQRKCHFQVIKMDAHMMLFNDNYFDVVVASHVIEHSPIPDVMLKEMHRVLKPRGLLFIEIPIEVELNNNSAHFSKWDERSFTEFVKTRFKIIRAERRRWFYIIGEKNEDSSSDSND